MENGIQTDRTEAPRPPEEIKNILCLGRIDPRKGQRYAVEVADLLLERNPELRFRVVGSSVPGDDLTQDYDHEIKTFTEKRSLTNISFKSEVADPFAEIAKADAVLFLSTEPETFGRVVIEALYLNKLLISFDQTGPREILKTYAAFLGIDTRPLLVEQDARSLAETVAEFADRPEKAKVFTEKAREFVIKHYNLTETKKRLLEILLDK